MQRHRVLMPLPDWLGDFFSEAGEVFATDDDRMRLAVALSRRNVVAGTGGPFGAAVFECETGRLVAAGVNVVEASCCAAAHAEVVALSLAGQKRGHYDLSREPACELATSCEPCSMCLGAVHWSGVRRLLCGARKADAEAVGFDEGDKPADWAALLAGRGIEVVRDLCRAEAAAVLADYARTAGAIYNPRRPRPAAGRGKSEARSSESEGSTKHEPENAG